MQYQYTAKSTLGELASGALEADSETAARRMLQEQGMSALSLRSVAHKRFSPSGMGSGFRKRIPKRDILMMTSQLAIMCRSGIDLAEGLQNVARHCKNQALKAALDTAYHDVSDGKAVSTALKKHSHIFGDAYVASVAAGEASGRVTDVLSRMSQLLRNEIRLQTTLRAILSYPIVLVCISCLVLSALVFFVLPQFAEVFRDLEIPAPPYTQLLMDIAQFIRENVWMCAGTTVGGAFLIIRGITSETGRRYRDRISLFGPVVRDVTRALLAGRTFRLMGTMLESGVPLLEAIQLCRTSVKNRCYLQLFDRMEHDVLNGDGVSDALIKTEFVPPGAAQMVETAERTGKLASVMVTIGEFYEEEGEQKLRELAKLLEPAIIVLMGVVVAFVVMSVMLPIFDFSSMSK